MAPTPDKYIVQWETNLRHLVNKSSGKNISTDGIIELSVVRAWAPIGVDHFWKLLQDEFYTSDAFFRVVPGFVVQFGICGVPAKNTQWENANIKDDPVVKSNTRGFVSYADAGPNTRTTQIFINYGNNSRLDSMGFTPFAEVVKGMDVADALYNPTPQNSDGVSQSAYSTGGNAWILKKYPAINFITKTKYWAVK